LSALQLLYNHLGSLLLQKLEKNLVKCCQTDLNRAGSHQRATSHVPGRVGPRRRPTGHKRRCIIATVGPTAPHQHPHPIPRCQAMHIHRPSKPTCVDHCRRPTNRAPSHTSHAARPCWCPCRDHCGFCARQVVIDRYKKPRAFPLARTCFRTTSSVLPTRHH
jgi:hypothetical protein